MVPYRRDWRGGLPARAGCLRLGRIDREVGLVELTIVALLALVRARWPALFDHSFFAATVIWTLLAALRGLGAPVDATLLPASADQVVLLLSLPTRKSPEMPI